MQPCLLYEYSTRHGNGHSIKVLEKKQVHFDWSIDISPKQNNDYSVFIKINIIVKYLGMILEQNLANVIHVM